MFKKQDNFLKLNEKINKFIDAKRFEEALRLYSQLSKLNEEKYEDLFNKTRIQLLTYQKINEISYALDSNDSEMIRHHLNLLEEYINVPTLKKAIKEFAVKKLEHFTKVYQYKIHKNEIEKLLEEVYHLINEANYDKALGLFPQIFDQYKQMIEYFPNEELYKYITEVRDNLKISLLEEKEYGKVAQLTKKK